MKQIYNSKSSSVYYKEQGESKKDRNMSFKLFSSYEGWDTFTYLNPIEGDLLEHRKKLGEDVLIATNLLAKCEYFMYSYSTMATLTILFNN